MTTMMKKILNVTVFALMTSYGVAAVAAKAPAAKKAAAPAIKGLKIEILKQGKGDVIKSGQQASVHYVGKLTNGKVFDTSRTRNQEFVFQIGAGNVIKGWDLGVEGMKVGELRKLTISPELGYGASGAGNAIPPNATLVFEVELMKIL